MFKWIINKIKSMINNIKIAFKQNPITMIGMNLMIAGTLIVNDFVAPVFKPDNIKHTYWLLLSFQPIMIIVGLFITINIIISNTMKTEYVQN